MSIRGLPAEPYAILLSAENLTVEYADLLSRLLLSELHKIPKTFIPVDEDESQRKKTEFTPYLVCDNINSEVQLPAISIFAEQLTAEECDDKYTTLCTIFMHSCVQFVHNCARI